ncbi:MAG: hypothetical protein KDA84_10365, partial [Planctomycetaceae bacterium]|nr:hypothetical protein [Planctomycetaceae bacterium]
MPSKPIALFALLTWMVGGLASATAGEQETLTVVVMDPLSKPLSCPCVEGYAQREYKALSAHLEK